MREKYESLSAGELREVAKARGLKGISALRKDELVQRMLEEDAKEQEKQIEDKKAEFGQLDSGIEANGILEVLADGYGFIRSDNYMPGENDVYVSPSQIRRFNLKTVSSRDAPMVHPCWSPLCRIHPRRSWPSSMRRSVLCVRWISLVCIRPASM